MCIEIITHVRITIISLQHPTPFKQSLCHDLKKKSLSSLAVKFFRSSIDFCESCHRNEANDTKTNMVQYGYVKHFNVTRGFGFIRPKHDKKSDGVFFHKSNIIQTLSNPLKRGDKVEFHVTMDMVRHRIHAASVKRSKHKRKNQEMDRNVNINYSSRSSTNQNQNFLYEKKKELKQDQILINYIFTHMNVIIFIMIVHQMIFLPNLILRLCSFIDLMV